MPCGSPEGLPRRSAERVLPGALQRGGGRRDGLAAPEVDVLGEAGSAVSEVVGDLTGRQASVVESGRDGPAEHVRGDPWEAGAIEAARRSPLVLLGSRSRPCGLGKMTAGSAALGWVSIRRRSRSTTAGGSARVRRPAVDLGKSWMTRPRLRMRMTVASTARVAAWRSTADGRMAQASPMRTPVLSRKSTRSGSARRTASGSAASRPRS